MKCPYRTIAITTDNSTTTEFAECYGKDCPWYTYEKCKNEDSITFEDCQRCHTEHTRANNMRNFYNAQMFK